MTTFGLDTNLPFSIQASEFCCWCNNSLQRIRNVYKGKGSTRLYCGSTCHQNGEERALRYVAALAGHIS